MSKHTPDKTEAEIDDLYRRIAPGTVYTYPRAVFQGLLLRTGGWIFYNGARYDVQGKHIGAGIYNVQLVAHDYGDGK